jgi:hypothetical protein
LFSGNQKHVFLNGATARGTERWPYFEMKIGGKVAAKPNPPMKNNPDSFFVEALDPRQEARALALEVICRLLLWMADEPSIEDRGLRTSVALYCVRPDLIDGETLARIGDASGRTRQHVHKLAESFRHTTGLKP